MLDNLTDLLRIILQYLEWRFKLYATNQTAIIVDQMGKVGSGSVMKSLEKQGFLINARF